MATGLQIFIATMAGVVIGAVVTDAVCEAEANRLAEKNHRAGFRQGVEMAGRAVNDCLSKNGIPARVRVMDSVSCGVAIVRATFEPTAAYYARSAA